MCESIVDIQSTTAEIRRGKKEEERRRRRKKKNPQDENIMSASATQGGHNFSIFVCLCIKEPVNGFVPN